MSHPAAMTVSNEDSRHSSLNFEPQNPPNTSNSVSLPSASAARPVPTYTGNDTQPRFDFEAYLRDLDPGTIYLVEVLRSDPAQVIARARKHGIDHLQRCYQSQRGAPLDRFEGHESLIIKHCPGLTWYPPGPNHAVQVKSYAVKLVRQNTSDLTLSVQSSGNGTVRHESTRPSR